MKLIVDTNILFSFFNSKSAARDLALRQDVLLYSPIFSIAELEKHRRDIIERFSISEMQFEFAKKLILSTVKFFPENEYKDFFRKAVGICPDPDDIDFFALALKLRCPLWSQDKALKKQTEISVLSTKEILDLLGESK